MATESPLNVVYLCKAVDETVPALATQVRWIRSLAGHELIGQVLVLAPKAGPATLPDNVTVRTIGRSRGAGSVVAFYQHLLRAPFRPDFYFVAQGGPYPAFLLPIKLATRRGVYQWKAHPHISRRMRFYARACDDLVFTATDSSFPLALPTRRVIGHGIDTDFFKPRDVPWSGDFVTVGRVSKAKGIDLMIHALAHCRREFGATYRLDVIGPVFSGQRGYHNDLLDLVSQLGLHGSVRFLGSVRQEELPALLSSYRASINFSRTALDKSAAEAMACGLPLVSTNACVAEALPAELHAQLIAPPGDVPAQAIALHRVMSWDSATRDAVGKRLRDTVCRDHSLTAFFGRILHEIDADRNCHARAA